MTPPAATPSTGPEHWDPDDPCWDPEDDLCDHRPAVFSPLRDLFDPYDDDDEDYLL